ncbi:MAG TPA: 2-amino-4-hydroxy-6-hydroxymethyldihydropteridine diphosphokinase [Bacillota bacterium]|nr:2-amino-4-hydroxy-6-hydroxymethyldihydropteridine diphosphokinase [Bacillota bacterium]
MNKAYVALGTNIEPRLDYLERAIKLLKDNKSLKIMKESSIYETAPVGYTDQSHFLNMVLVVETSLSAIALLDACQAIEQELGRERTIRFGPRTIDLDILVYNEDVIDTERLTVPHPRMDDRAFVLVPLAELTDKAIVNESGETVKDKVAALDEESLREVKQWQQR